MQEIILSLSRDNIQLKEKIAARVNVVKDLKDYLEKYESNSENPPLDSTIELNKKR